MSIGMPRDISMKKPDGKKTARKPKAVAAPVLMPVEG